ncbi:hydroxyacylglutathione hydrolase [Parvularcula sp. IMCC14364]|uniref:hydroxyacylglutathione hydrolase n=1 Tax=Parvularcula sp. IMCC14364 TaxID=3067902 RepID=UPI002742710D|nr:hydroxyacylglutathione hydrolase [Parvularcula sp. IMCC14364]
MRQVHKFKAVDVCQFPCLNDNYGFLVRDRASGQCAAIDTPDAQAISAAAAAEGWQISHIWNTHWHPDHTGGNSALKEHWNCEVIGPAAEAGRIPAADRLVEGGETVRLGDVSASVIATPGHTTGHIVFHLPGEQVAFVGDTLFALGCGRLFEGSPAQMWDSLLKLRALPDDTTVFCAHEYTAANARFAVTVEPDNTALQTRHEEIIRLRRDGIPTVPTKVGIEKETNPFLRADHAALKAGLGMTAASDVDVFAEVRQRKDNF